MLRRGVSVLDYVRALLHEKDLRDQQRFEAQSKAVDTAMLAQTTAMQAALQAAEKAVDRAMTAAEKAVTKAEAATEKRFEGVNEFRQALSDQTATFPSRVELQALAERLNDLQTRMERAEGAKGGVSSSVAMMFAAVGVILTIVGVAVAIFASN